MKEKIRIYLGILKVLPARIRQMKGIVARYNLFCFFHRHVPVKPDTQIKPIWIFGMFRSGTSLTSEILKEMNTDFGPESHLLQPIGRLKDLNPNGFFENYVFAEYSRYFLAQINAAGDQPPQDHLIEKLGFEKVNERKLFRFSIHKIKEDRITTVNKYESFKRLRKRGLNQYLKECFQQGRPAIKIPLLSFFHRPITEVWPLSEFLIVFRHPVSTINSSKVLTERSDYELYKKYYTKLLELKKIPGVYFFSYDELIVNPQESITILANVFNLGVTEEQVGKLAGKIDSNLIRNKPQEINDPEAARLYTELSDLAINAGKK
jgi:hypothetical protein